MGPQQPAKDQLMPIAERGLERREQTRYFLGQPGHPDHGEPPVQARLMSFNPPSAYLLGGTPASTPLVWLSGRRPLKKLHYQDEAPLILSTLSD
jgi:hypothetical protein